MFYRSLGWFALSVPIPLYLLDVANTVTGAVSDAFESGSHAEILNDLFNSRHLALSGYIAGMFLAGALFANMIVDLFDYVYVVGMRSG